MEIVIPEGVGGGAHNHDQPGINSVQLIQALGGSGEQMAHFPQGNLHGQGIAAAFLEIEGAFLFPIADLTNLPAPAVGESHILCLPEGDFPIDAQGTIGGKALGILLPGPETDDIKPRLGGGEVPFHAAARPGPVIAADHIQADLGSLVGGGKGGGAISGGHQGKIGLGRWAFRLNYKALPTGRGGIGRIFLLKKQASPTETPLFRLPY